MSKKRNRNKIIEPGNTPQTANPDPAPPAAEVAPPVETVAPGALVETMAEAREESRALTSAATLPPAPPEIPGWYDWHEWAKGIIAALPDEAVYVELGCFLGRSTCAIGRLIVESGKRITLVAVDTFSLPAEAPAMLRKHVADLAAPDGSCLFHDRFRKNLDAAGVRGVVVPMRLTTLAAAEEAPDAAADVVFVDADHSYEAVRADIRAWWPKLKPGGVMAGHDIRTFDSVWRAVHDELATLGRKPTIVSAQNLWEVRK